MENNRKEYTHTYKTESLSCMPETNTILQINYSSVLKNQAILLVYRYSVEWFWFYFQFSVVLLINPSLLWDFISVGLCGVCPVEGFCQMSVHSWLSACI